MLMTITITIVALMLLFYIKACKLELKIDRMAARLNHEPDPNTDPSIKKYQRNLKWAQSIPTIFIVGVWLIQQTIVNNWFNYCGLSISLIINWIVLKYGYQWLDKITTP